MHSARKARKLDPLEVFNLTEEEYRLLEYVANRPRRWKGFSYNTLDSLKRRHLVRTRHYEQIAIITDAGDTILRAIRALGCT